MFTGPARWLIAPVAAHIVTVAIFPAVVLGHAELATASPADRSTVTTPPSEIVFTFTEPLVPAKSSLKLVDGAGKIVAQDSTVDAANARTMRLVLSQLPPGPYTIRWTTASALDGDIAHGTTSFTLAAPTPSLIQSQAPSAGSSASVASPAPSSVAAVPSPPPSGGTGIPTSTADAIIPVIAAVIIVAALGLWLRRGRSRRAG